MAPKFGRGFPSLLAFALAGCGLMRKQMDPGTGKQDMIIAQLLTDFGHASLC
jgi:hypothetical protein